MRGPARHNRAFIPWAVLGLALSITTATAAITARMVSQRDDDRFLDAVQASEDRIRDQMSAYEEMLLGARAFVAVPGAPDATVFERYVQELDVPHRYPGVQGLGYAERIGPGEELQLRAPVEVWPRRPGQEQFPILLLEPLDRRNQAALGYDMFSEPVRREAMERARDTGEPAMSGPVTLVQEIDPAKQIGFNLYMPVYRGVRKPATVEERRARLLGFVYSPFRTGDLFSGIFGSEEHPRIAFEIQDLGPAGAVSLFRSETTGDDPGFRPRWRAERVLHIAGRSWRVTYRSRPVFERDSGSSLVSAVVLGGAALSLLLFALARVQARERDAAERLAREHGFLAQVHQSLTGTLDPHQAARALAELAVPALGDYAVVDLVDADGNVERVGLAPADPSRRPLVERMKAVRPAGRTSSPVAQVLHEGRSLVIPRWTARHTAEVVQDASHRALIEEMQIRSMLCVPLAARDRVLGMLSLFSSERAYSERDVALAESLGRGAALAIDNAQLYSQAQEAARAREVFLSVASHELKTPLTAVQLGTEGLARVLDRGALEKAAIRERAGRVQAQVKRLSQLVDDLLDVSRITAGRLSLELEQVDLAEVVREVAARFADQSARGKTPITLELPDALPGRWDRNRLEQVLTNLLSNALKYGAGKPVVVSLEPRGNTARLRVSDQGIGIAPEHQARIFERFERFVSERHYGGLGLGLWITREIVDALGGHIEVESAPGQGSTFTVELPRSGPEAFAQDQVQLH